MRNGSFTTRDVRNKTKADESRKLGLLVIPKD